MNILVTIMSILTFIAVIIMIYKILIEYKQNLEREFEKLQQENKQLKEEIEEIEEYKRIEQEDLKAFNNYDSILTELEEWLNECLEKGDKHKFIVIRVKDVLDKIQELKEKYK